MTTLGKALAVLNLVLSIFVGALIVMNYVARTNWHGAYVNLEKQAKVADADRKTYFEETVRLKDAVAKAEQEAAKAVEAKNEAVRQQEAVVAASNKRLSDEQRNRNSIQGTFASVTAELDRRQREVNYLTNMIGQRDEQLKKYEKAAEDSRDRAVQEEMRAKSEHQRNLAMLQKIEEQAKQIQKLEHSGGPGVVPVSAPQSNPPQGDIAGVIVKTDPQSGLVTLDIGSDAGLSKGNTLEVFHLAPDPKYLGTIEILAVRPNEAVGKQIGTFRSQLHVGDRVSSNILTRR
jgi:hypothetical protein